MGTGGPATSHRRHRLKFPPRALHRPYEKLLQFDKQLFQLSKSRFPRMLSPFFFRSKHHPVPFINPSRGQVNLYPDIPQAPVNFSLHSDEHPRVINGQLYPQPVSVETPQAYNEKLMIYGLQLMMPPPQVSNRYMMIQQPQPSYSMMQISQPAGSAAPSQAPIDELAMMQPPQPAGSVVPPQASNEDLMTPRPRII